MITQALMEFVVFGLLAVTNLAPSSWANNSIFAVGGSMDSAMAEIVDYARPMSGWVPFGTAANVLQLMFTCFTFGVVHKLLKLALRSITGGGTPE